MQQESTAGSLRIQRIENFYPMSNVHWKLKLQKLLKTLANFSTRSYKQTNRQINPFGAPPSHGFPPLLSNVQVITHQGPKSLLLLFTLSANCKLVERALDVLHGRKMIFELPSASQVSSIMDSSPWELYIFFKLS